MTSFVLAIDQGTTSTRAILFRADTSVAAVAQQEFPQHFPADGEVEHEPEDLWTTTVATCRHAMRKAGASARDIVAIGIANQRETTLLWDRVTGRPVHRAIVWQDRRTADLCARLREDGHEKLFAAKTGLLLDPYFSGTKLAWLLNRAPNIAERAARGDLAFGTVDTYLLWRLTGGKVHATDATNASRTLLFNIHEGRWDDQLLKLLGIPKAVLPQVMDCSAAFGMTAAELFEAGIPICGIAGDQQAALVGQACFAPGMLKATYGTGCFALLNTGRTPVASQHKLLTTIAYQLDGMRTYALEGAIFVAGASVQWLRDSLHVVRSAEETGELAKDADPTQEVILVPAFVGLGAPYWRPDVRGALFGLTRATGPRELARAALESVCFQTADLLGAMKADWREAATALKILRVDGGMANSDWCMQRLADLIGSRVDRPQIKETTALGAAYLAGMRSGFFPEPDRFVDHWQLERRFTPRMDAALRERKLAAWTLAVRRLLA
ncbi:MAG TPA: glycerol kinase GlpK [Xanthobacteraceae bacterium]|nr:glycerol kinase GlpK [Xanthobacteraceae bacterium]